MINPNRKSEIQNPKWAICKNKGMYFGFQSMQKEINNLLIQ